MDGVGKIAKFQKRGKGRYLLHPFDLAQYTMLLGTRKGNINGSCYDFQNNLVDCVGDIGKVKWQQLRTMQTNIVPFDKAVIPVADLSNCRPVLIPLSELVEWGGEQLTAKRRGWKCPSMDEFDYNFMNTDISESFDNGYLYADYGIQKHSRLYDTIGSMINIYMWSTKGKSEAFYVDTFKGKDVLFIDTATTNEIGGCRNLLRMPLDTMWYKVVSKCTERFYDGTGFYEWDTKEGVLVATYSLFSSVSAVVFDLTQLQRYITENRQRLYSASVIGKGNRSRLPVFNDILIPSLWRQAELMQNAELGKQIKRVLFTS